MLEAAYGQLGGTPRGVRYRRRSGGVTVVTRRARLYGTRRLAPRIEGIAGGRGAGAIVFHAGTAVRDGQNSSRNGGRILSMTAGATRSQTRDAPPTSGPHMIRGREIPAGTAPMSEALVGILSDSESDREGRMGRRVDTREEGRSRIRVRRATRTPPPDAVAE